MGTNHATVFVFGGFLEIKYDSNCSLKKKKEYASNSQNSNSNSNKKEKPSVLCLELNSPNSFFVVDLRLCVRVSLSLSLSLFVSQCLSMSLSSLALDSNPIRVPQTPFLGARHHHLRPIILPRRPNLIVCSSVSASASLSVAESSTTQGTNRIGSLSQVSGVLGCQWGDEGKGKLVEIGRAHV